MQAIVARDGGDWEPQSIETTIDYVLPPHASDEIRDLFRPDTSVTLAEDFIARLPGGRVFGSGAILSADGKSIARDVSVDFGKPFEEHWLLSFKKIRPPVFVAGTTAVVATALSAGYAHWLLEELPRLLVLGAEEFATVIAHGTSQFSREALTRLSLSAKVLEPRRYSHFGCERLLVPSLISPPGFPSRRVGRLLTDFTADLGGQQRAGFGDRLYLSREKARRRRVTNDTELWDWLRPRGFVKLCAEELTWSEQIEVFRRAKVIVAAHGAGLANIVFCQPGTKIVEFFNRSYVNGCYWRLASIQGLDYRPIVAAGSEPLTLALEANSLDINVDLPLIAKTLSDA
jgi:capsular polysaccharide biosynthesis protein